MKDFPAINIPVRVPGALRRSFDEAWETCTAIVFAAGCGSGKTVTVQALLEGRKAYYIDAFAGFEVRELIGARNFDCIVIDNAQELDDSYTIKCVRSLVDSVPHMRVLVLTRGCVPSWLSPYRIRGLVKVFSDRDLFLPAMDIAHLANDYGASISSADLNRIVEHTRGYPLAVAVIARRLAAGQVYDGVLGRESAREIHDFFISEVYDRLDTPTKRMVCRLSLFESFTPALARVVTDDEAAGQRLERLRKTSSAFEPDPGDSTALRMKGLWRRSLAEQVRLMVSDAQREEIFTRAGSYYSKEGDVVRALECFERAHREDLIRQQLIDNARSYVRLDNYRGAEPYYLRISRGNILNSPLLIYGMSVLSSLQSRTLEAEQWREELLAFARDTINDPVRRREARMRYAFLKLVLPQYGSSGYIESLHEVAHMLEETQVPAPKCSLVAGSPGFLGGIHDFSDLMLEQGGDISAYQDDFERVFGMQGRFFARYIATEYAFGQGRLKKFQLHELSRALPAIHREGLQDMEFAVNSIIARGELYFGNANAAFEVVDAMLKSFANGKTSSDLLQRTRTLRCRIALYTKKESVVSDWLVTEAPPLFGQPLPERSYSYMTQSFAYLVRGEYRKALYAIDNVEVSGPDRKRVLNDVFCHIIVAICDCQLGNDSWRRALLDAIECAAPYSYIGIFEQFGDLLRPLLEELDFGEESDFTCQLKAFAAGELGEFPTFGRSSKMLENPLTAAEQRVLELLCEDKSNAQICDELGVKLPTVKTHVSHIFAKLGCKRRADARNIALELGLV